MPAKSNKQQKFMGMVHAAQKGEKPASARVAKVAKSIKKKDAEDFASTKHKGKPEKVKQETKVRRLIRNMVRDIMKENEKNIPPKSNVPSKPEDSKETDEPEITDIPDNPFDKEEMEEAKKRDYKAEYKKFQSSDKMKKYRAELNKYNRDKGTYGNRDGKDASHKGGKIVGMEDENINRGRAEKSRLTGSKRKC